jgi:hypothetical protein
MEEEEEEENCAQRVSVFLLAEERVPCSAVVLGPRRLGRLGTLRISVLPRRSQPPSPGVQMCKLHPGRVFPYLKACAHTEASYARSGEGMQNPVPYRLEGVLELTRTFRILDATAFLLEKKGDFAGAYALVHATLKENVTAFDTAYVHV